MKLPKLTLQKYEEYKNFNINEVLDREFVKIKDSNDVVPINNSFDDYTVINIVNGIPFLREDNTFISLEKKELIETETSNPFISLNYSYSNEEFILKISSTPKKPVLLVNTYTTKNSFVTSNLKIVIDNGIKVDLLEINDSKVDFLGINNRVVIINNGTLNYTRKDKDNKESNLVYNYNIEINSGIFNSISLNKEGNVNINNWLVNLNKEDSKTNIYGIVELDDSKKHGSVCIINHNCKETYSVQEFRHILDDNSYAMYHGDTIIKSGAINSNAAQNSKAIMLSDTSRILNKPRLNVFTGEVKATHGATVGRLNNEDIFYLKQRGISEKEIKLILIKAFIIDVVDKIESEVIRGYVYD